MYDVINRINYYVLNPLIVLLFAVALLLFVWGVYSLYILNGEGEKRTEGAKHIMYGLIGMVIMIGAFALIHFITNSLTAVLGIPVTTPNTLPH